jgi:hypothetical protein
VTGSIGRFGSKDCRREQSVPYLLELACAELGVCPGRESVVTPVRREDGHYDAVGVPAEHPG